MIKSWICRANLNHDPNDILSFMVKASTEYSAMVMARKEIDRLKARCMDIRTVDEIRVTSKQRSKTFCQFDMIQTHYADLSPENRVIFQCANFKNCEFISIYMNYI